MNKELFEQASVQYCSQEYNDALEGFTECLQDEDFPPEDGEIGLLYHKIGNCLIKLRNPSEAIQSYTQAAADEAYHDQGTVECNLGMAYASLRDYDNALSHFEAAVTDDSYMSPYKAYMGMGNALLKLGKSAEAGVAFREAALDQANPDPTKALLNLGVCFMALDRPADAVASYESALQFRTSQETANKLNANLGQAYVACGQMEKAVDAFEKALADKTYTLSDSASVDYQQAVSAIAQGIAEPTQVLDIADMTGLDVTAGGTVIDESYPEEQDPFYYDEGYDDISNYPGYIGAFEDDDEDRFFSASEEELERWSKDLAKQDRKRRNVGLKVLIVVIIVIIVLLAAAVVGYVAGYGIPTQQSVTEKLFENPEAAADDVFASSVSDSNKDVFVGIVVPDSDVVIDGIDRSMSDSTVYATATTPEGGKVTYSLTMVRDLLGWKISDVDLYMASQN